MAAAYAKRMSVSASRHKVKLLVPRWRGGPENTGHKQDTPANVSSHTSLMAHHARSPAEAPIMQYNIQGRMTYIICMRESTEGRHIDRERERDRDRERGRERQRGGGKEGGRLID